MTEPTKNWDAFFSYNWGIKRSNQKKVIEIRNYITSELQIKTWIDMVEMKSGDLSKNVFNGIKGSKLFICFITSDYSDSKNCMNELCLAKKLGKEIIFYISEDISGMSQDVLTKNVLKEVAFYMGESVYYTRKNDLRDAVKKSLNKQSDHKIKFDGEIFVYVSYDDSAFNTTKNLISILKPIFDVNFDMKKELDKFFKLKSCDLFVAIVNSEYTSNYDCLEEYTEAVNQGKRILRLNLEQNLTIANESTSDKIQFFNLYNDEKSLYFDGEGRLFVNLVNWLENNLPKTIDRKENSNDLMVIVSQAYKSKIDNNLKLHHSILFSKETENRLIPEYSKVTSSKVILAVVCNEVNENEKFIEELKFANSNGKPLFVIEDIRVDYLDPDIRDILKTIPQENQFQGIEKLDNKEFMKLLSRDIEKAIDKTTEEEALIIAISNEDGSEFKTAKILKAILLKSFLIGCLFLVVLLLFSVITLVFAGVSFNKMRVQPTKAPNIIVYTTTNGSMLSTQPPEIGLCAHSSSKAHNFAKDGYRGMYEYRRVLNKKILAVVEICFLEQSFFVLHFGDEILMIHKNKDIARSLIPNGKRDMVQMVTTHKNLVFIDNSDLIFVYDFNLNSTRNVSVGMKSGGFNSLIYDENKKLLYVLDTNGLLYIFNNLFEKIDQKTLKFVEPNQNLIMSFDSAKKNLYLVYKWLGYMQQVSIDSYEMVDKMNLTKFGELVSCFVDKNDFIYTFNTNVNLNTSQIHVMRFGSNSPFKVTTYNNALHSFGFIDSKNMMAIASKDTATDFYFTLVLYS